MNPNSGHQRWSRWIYRVEAPGSPRLEIVRQSCRAFGWRRFGSVSVMRVERKPPGLWEIAILSEGHPVHDPGYARWMHGELRRFLTAAFGPEAKITTTASLVAGSRDDGTAPDQLIIMPGAIRAHDLTLPAR